MTRNIKAFKVDAFIKDNSGGSPTAVVLNASGLTDEQMQFITNQLGASHTAFVFEPAQQDENAGVRFFTPHGEILNCGHGTIAAHYARAKHFNFTGNRILFQQAKEGVQQIEIVQDCNQIEIFLRQNPIKFSLVSSDTIKYLLTALAISDTDLADNLPIILASPGSNRFLVGIKSPQILNKITPDFDKLKLVCSECKSIGCFAYSIDRLQPKLEAAARMFAPAIGVNEDIINGNSSGCLGTYLLLLNGENNLDLRVTQGKKFSREGVVRVKVKKVGGHFETVIGGFAKIQAEIVVDLNDIPITDDNERQN